MQLPGDTSAIHACRNMFLTPANIWTRRVCVLPLVSSCAPAALLHRSHSAPTLLLLCGRCSELAATVKCKGSGLKRSDLWLCMLCVRALGGISWCECASCCPWQVGTASCRACRQVLREEHRGDPQQAHTVRRRDTCGKQTFAARNLEAVPKQEYTKPRATGAEAHPQARFAHAQARLWNLCPYPSLRTHVMLQSVHTHGHLATCPVLLNVTCITASVVARMTRACWATTSSTPAEGCNADTTPTSRT